MLRAGFHLCPVTRHDEDLHSVLTREAALIQRKLQFQPRKRVAKSTDQLLVRRDAIYGRISFAVSAGAAIFANQSCLFQMDDQVATPDPSVPLRRPILTKRDLSGRLSYVVGIRAVTMLKNLAINATNGSRPFVKNAGLRDIRRSMIGDSFHDPAFYLGIDQLIATCAVICIAFVGVAHAHAAELIKEKKSTVKSTKGKTCQIRITDPFGGKLTESSYELTDLPYKKTNVEYLSLYLECASSDDADAAKRFVYAIFDVQHGTWQPDFTSLSEEDLALLKPVTRIFSLKAINSSGVGVTQDAVNGDSKQRSRAFTFCLRHPPVMLCGSTSTIAYPYYSKSGVMPYALRILSSLEFVDDRENGANPIAPSVVLP